MNVNLIGKGFGGGKSRKGKGKGKHCYNCGAIGHMSWECPKGKGKGKEKGARKGAWQQWSLNGGKGKSGKGSKSCCACGSFSHLIANCPSNRSVQAVDIDEGEPEVLYIGHVDSVWCPTIFIQDA